MKTILKIPVPASKTRFVEKTDSNEDVIHTLVVRWSILKVVHDTPDDKRRQEMQRFFMTFFLRHRLARVHSMSAHRLGHPVVVDCASQHGVKQGTHEIGTEVCLLWFPHNPFKNLY